MTRLIISAFVIRGFSGICVKIIKNILFGKGLDLSLSTLDSVVHFINLIKSALTAEAINNLICHMSPLDLGILEHTNGLNEDHRLFDSSK